MYPFLRKRGINFTPIKKITVGFFIGTTATIWATVIQSYIYKTSPCGKYLTDPETCHSHINVWVQAGPYVLIAASEIFASVASLEYAFTKAPKSMRSFVQAFSLFNSSISAAIGEAFTGLAADPYLEWNYGVVAVICFLGGCLFWRTYRDLDREEDRLNMLPTGSRVATSAHTVDPEAFVPVKSEK